MHKENMGIRGSTHRESRWGKEGVEKKSPQLKKKKGKPLEKKGNAERIRVGGGGGGKRRAKNGGVSGGGNIRMQGLAVGNKLGEGVDKRLK